MQAKCKSASRYKGIYEPKCSCIACWDIYFNKQPMQAGLAQYGMNKFGEEKVVSIKGERFVKQVKRYLAEHPDILPPKPPVVEEKAAEVEHCKRCSVPLNNEGFCIACGRSGK